MDLKRYLISLKMLSSPDWNGMWKNSHIFGSSAQALTSLSVKYLQQTIEHLGTAIATVRDYVRLLHTRSIARFCAVKAQAGLIVNQTGQEVLRQAGVPGVGGRETNALNARHIMDMPEQVCEGPCSPAGAISGHARQVPSIGVHILAQEGDLLVPCLAQGCHFSLQVRLHQ